MTGDARQVPAGSQTVGPYFRIGLDYLMDRAPTIDAATAGAIEIRGRVLDRDGAPVPDAMLEFWAAGTGTTLSSSTLNHTPYPMGFRRAATDGDGNFTVVAARPAAVALGDGRMQAPHMFVLVFARGLLRHLISRVYFEDEPGNVEDAVLQQVPVERRGSLIAQRESDRENLYRWNLILQGQDETVFFAW
jgi:protocatechuate 3,4-dioxygenase, alpha subunit